MISITVVIPTHKRDELLSRSIESAMNQSFQVNEILVVDDAGLESTKMCVEAFGRSYIRYLHNENGNGASSSRNLGIIESTSDFIAFLDDDDIWYPEKIEKQVALMAHEELDACFTQIKIQYEGNNKLSYPTKSKLPTHITESILMDNFIGATISSVVRKSALREVGMFDIDFPAREEYDLWIKLILNGARIGIVEEPLAVSYRSFLDRDRISSNINSYIRANDLLNKKYKHIIDSNFSPIQKKSRLKSQQKFIAAQAVSIGDRKNSVKFYFKSLMLGIDLVSIFGLFLCAISPKLLIKIRSKVS